jgi:hypothetical protein
MSEGDHRITNIGYLWLHVQLVVLDTVVNLLHGV